MLIECSYCQSRVDGKLLGQHKEAEHEEFSLLGEYQVSLLECPACKRALVGWQELIQVGPEEYEWSGATRVYPEPETFQAHSIPPHVWRSLLEARQCYRARAFSACAVMCGRAIEAMCHSHTAAKTTLAQGLVALRDAGVIDGRLYDWGESLRQERNIGAHASEETITQQDARDVLDFAIAICEYVYVLSDRYDQYRARKKAKAKADSAPPAPASDE